MVLLDPIKDIGQQLALKLNDVLGAIDETEFDVQRIVLSEVTAG